jgi:four helix bundle protein
MDRFPFRRLIVYRRAVEMVSGVSRLAARIPRDHLDLRWQLMRAARSVVLNIAEGAGEYSPKEKARIYRIARRSGWETIGALDLAVQDRYFESSEIDIVLQQIDEITAMLTAMFKRAEQRVPRPRPRCRPEDEAR